MSETNGEKPLIFGLMAKILSEIGAISKNRRNEQQGYAFRGIDDMYNALHPLFAEHGIFTTPRVLHKSVSERVTNSGSTLRFVELTVAYDFFASDGSSVTVETVGEAMDAGDKASNKALSAAHKYALIQAFCIPTGEAPEADFDSPPDSRPAFRPPPKSDVPTCPDCGAGMWDNREKKLNPRSPDFKCKDKDCGKGIWLADDAGQLTPKEAAIAGLMAQAEKLLPPTSKKLAELRGISDPDELGKKVQILSDLAKKKQNVTGNAERQRWIENVRSAFAGNAIDEHAYLIEKYDGAELTELSVEQLQEIHDSIDVPF